MTSVGVYLWFMCADGPVVDPGRCRPPTFGRGALLHGGGDRGGHPELCEVCPQPLCCGKEHLGSFIRPTAFHQSDTF